MPTFKADFARFDERAGAEENVKHMFDEYNRFVSKVAKTINNLDEENFTQSLIDTLKGDGSHE